VVKPSYADLRPRYSRQSRWNCGSPPELSICQRQFAPRPAGRQDRRGSRAQNPLHEKLWRRYSFRPLERQVAIPPRCETSRPSACRTLGLSVEVVLTAGDPTFSRRFTDLPDDSSLCPNCIPELAQQQLQMLVLQLLLVFVFFVTIPVFLRKISRQDHLRATTPDLGRYTATRRATS
jgi:hypothetical protein